MPSSTRSADRGAVGRLGLVALVALVVWLSGCTSAAPSSNGVAKPAVAAPDAAACASAASELTVAEGLVAEGRLLRAEAIVAGVSADCAGSRGRAVALGATITQRLSGIGTIDAFEEMERARKAGPGVAAREHWDRAARSLERVTGKRGRPVYLRLREELGEGVRRGSPMPAWHKGEVVIVAARSPGAPLSPVRWVEEARALGAGEMLSESGGTARWLSAERTNDEALGEFELDSIATNTSRWLVACDRRGLRLFDRRDQRLENEVVRDCASKYVITGVYRLVELGASITLLVLPTLEVVAEFPRGEGLAERWAADRDGRTFVIVEGGELDPEVVVRVFDLIHGVEIASLRRPQPAPLQIAVSPSGGKVLMVDETIQVFDIGTRRTTWLGNRVFHKLRSGHYAHYGWGDTVTPPAGTGAIAALDDGRACIEQAGTAAIVPRSATEHCSIGADHRARVGTVRSSGTTTWVTPPASTEDSRSTVRVAASGREVLRIETRRRPAKECPPNSKLSREDLSYEPCTDESFVVTYEAVFGAELRRASVGFDSVAFEASAEEGSVVRLTIGGSSQEAGTERLFDSMTGKMSDAPRVGAGPWYMPSVNGGLMQVREQPLGIVRTWDLRTLQLAKANAPSKPRPALPGLSLVEGYGYSIAAFSTDTADPASKLPLAWLVPMNEGVAAFFATGEVELFGVTSPPDDLVCSYGRLLVPFETCAGTAQVEGAWKETLAKAKARVARKKSK